jgi:hypothetical protein
VIIDLSRPIQAHGEERTQIDLREPNGGDVAACGFPFKFYATEDGTNVVITDTNVISAFISRLGNITKGAVAQMNVNDWRACMVAVLGFFGETSPETETLSNGASTLRIAGNGTPGSH